MKHFSIARSGAAALFAAVMMTPALAFAQGATALGGFGGFTANALQSQRPSLGGTITFDVNRNVQVIGEAGRIGNVLPALSSTVFSAAQTGLRVSAFYGEGGVRFLAAPSSNVTPYAEATAGMARVDVNSTHLGGVGNLVTSLALGLVGRTSPMAGVGGGLLVRGGPVVFDVGYRYKQLFADDLLQVALGFGQPLRAHQFRAGIGVRF
jgi:hypothetical protein